MFSLNYVTKQEKVKRVAKENFYSISGNLKDLFTKNNSFYIISKADVDKAVVAAKKAFERGSVYRSMDASARGKLLWKYVLFA